MKITHIGMTLHNKWYRT